MPQPAGNHWAHGTQHVSESAGRRAARRDTGAWTGRVGRSRAGRARAQTETRRLRGVPEPPRWDVACLRGPWAYLDSPLPGSRAAGVLTTSSANLRGLARSFSANA